MVIDETACMVRLALRTARFYAEETCGQCTQCREGTWWMEQVLHRIEHGQGVAVGDLHDLADERAAGRRTAGAGREDENQDEREAFHGGNCSARTVESIDFAPEASRVSQAGAPTDSTAWLAGTFVRRRADQFAIGRRANLCRNLLL